MAVDRILDKKFLEFFVKLFAFEQISQTLVVFIPVQEDQAKLIEAVLDVVEKVDCSSEWESRENFQEHLVVFGCQAVLVSVEEIVAQKVIQKGL